MVDFCNVSGFIYRPNGTAVANTPVRIQPDYWSATSNGVASPSALTVTTSALGLFSTPLRPGTYRIAVGSNPTECVIAVPDTASAALDDLLVS